MGGACFRHLHVEQGVQQTVYFLQQWRLDSRVGRLFKCIIAWLQLSVEVFVPSAGISLKTVTAHGIVMDCINASVSCDHQYGNPIG